MLTIFLYAPWAWLLFFCLMILGVFLQFGHWPSYTNPDPKQIGVFSHLITPVYALIILTLISPIYISFQAIRSWYSKAGMPWHNKQLMIYFTGMLIFSLVMFFDIYGLRNWFLD